MDSRVYVASSPGPSSRRWALPEWGVGMVQRGRRGFGQNLAMHTRVSMCMHVRLFTVRVKSRDEECWRKNQEPVLHPASNPTNVRSELEPKNDFRNWLHQCLMSSWNGQEGPSPYKHICNSPGTHLGSPLESRFSRLSVLRHFSWFSPYFLFWHLNIVNIYSSPMLTLCTN